MNGNKIMRMLPAVDAVLKEREVQAMIEEYGYASVLQAVRTVLDQIRDELKECDTEKEAEGKLRQTNTRIRIMAEQNTKPGLRPVLNGTGVILHTGLGRAPLGERALCMGVMAAGGYTNLEYDLETGSRGNRCGYLEKLLCRITDAQAAMAVNNNAGAVLLVLSAVAGGGEAVVSRGELVEIGGGFRVPEVMELSGVRLREVGTTNRTRVSDYEDAVGDDTKAVLKVHTSNYRIVGFTESVEVEKLAVLCRDRELPLIVDLGSGVLADLDSYGLPHEPTVQETVHGGADIVCFSGDKLLGGPQAGVIVGKKEYIDKLRKHPLARALRIDKFTAAAMESVLLDYLDPETVEKKIPALRMLAKPVEEVRKAAEKLAAEIVHPLAGIMAEPCLSQAGGGALPGVDIPSWAVAISPAAISAQELEYRLRQLDLPVISIVRENRVLLDMRTFEADRAAEMISAFRDGSILGPDSFQRKEGILS